MDDGLASAPQDSTSPGTGSRLVFGGLEVEGDLGSSKIVSGGYFSEPKPYTEDPDPFNQTDVARFSTAAEVLLSCHQPEQKIMDSLSSDRDGPLPNEGLNNEETSIDRDSLLANAELGNEAMPVTAPESSVDPDSGTAFSEYETDLDDEETIDVFQDLDLSKISHTCGETLDRACGEVIRKVLSPVQQAVLDWVMAEVWMVFKQRKEFFR